MNEAKDAATIRNFLFPGLPAEANLTPEMVEEQLKKYVNKPAVHGSEILTLRAFEENGQTLFRVERVPRAKLAERRPLYTDRTKRQGTPPFPKMPAPRLCLLRIVQSPLHP
jgi:hypothetical protein